MAPVVIPALAPTLDKSLKADGAICQVRALHYYLGKGIRPQAEQGAGPCLLQRRLRQDCLNLPCHYLLVVKQTVILCYEISDQEALTLHQVKAHDVKAFDA